MLSIDEILRLYREKPELTAVQIAALDGRGPSQIQRILKRNLPADEYDRLKRTKYSRLMKTSGRRPPEQTPEMRRRASERARKYSGPAHPRWKGGRYINSDGYVYVWNPNHPNCDANGYVLEHRLVMEQKIGRLLRPEEVVHHLNGIKHDNRPENLELLANLSEHVSRHPRKRDKLGRFTGVGLRKEVSA